MAAGAMMLGSAIAQQTPASNPKPAATATQAPSATAAKPHPPVAKTATPLVLKTDKDKTGYAIGAFFGAQMRRDSLDVDPKIVAKGIRLNALQIRQIAEEHQVPVVENQPLARLMFKYGRVGGEIPAQLYAAVAEILDWVYRVNAYRYYREQSM